MRSDYRLIAVVDPLNEVVETSEDNNRAAFRGGAVIAPNGTLHVHGTDTADTVTINVSPLAAASAASVSITLQINAWIMDYASTSVKEIHLRLHGGDDVLEAAAEITQNIHAYGGDGNDRIVSGAGSDWLIGGDGDDLLAGLVSAESSSGCIA